VPGIITLTTDFGLSDPYVGIMKGVILGMNPEVHIVDLNHHVDAYDVLGASLTLAAGYSYFPQRTVHVIVVDPGVGSSRRPIAAEAGSWLFVAPDNGVLELVFRAHSPTVWSLRADEFALKPTSTTFHGRDVFAPAAALLAKGVPPDELGDRIDDFARLSIPEPRSISPQLREGVVLKVDRFGNLITNLRVEDLRPGFMLIVGDTQIQTLRSSYAAGAPGEVFLIVGSSGYVEISMNQGSAAEATGALAGAPVTMAGGSVEE